LVGTLPGTALANNDTGEDVSEEGDTTAADSGDTTNSGTEDSDAADSSAGDIAANIEMDNGNDTAAADTQETESTDSAAATLPANWSPGMGVRSGTDVTGYIGFSEGELSNTTGGSISQSSGNSFPYELYTLTVDWAADLDALGRALVAGDYFEFTLPGDVFKSMSFNITVGNTVWATVVVDANGGGKVTFTSAVATLGKVDGTLKFEKYYTEASADVPVNWDFIFGDETYHYEGTSAGRLIPNGSYENDNVKTSSAIVDGSIYGWMPILNINEESWTGEITITDTLGDYHIMRTYYNSGLSTNYGYYGADNYETMNAYGLSSGANANYYFSIAVVDWTRMRSDYNDLIAWNAAQSYTTIHYYTGGTNGGGVLDSTGTLTDSGYALSAPITSGYTSFMREKMRGFTSSGKYLYMERYTDGLVSVTVSDNGYTIVFPDGALDGQSLQLYYYTEMTGVTSPSRLTNSITVSVPGVDDDKVTSSVNVRGGGTITGQRDYLTIYKYDSSERGTLSNATFTLKKIDGYTAEFDPVTTGTDGKIAFYLLSKITTGYAGTYTLTETSFPDGYVGVGEITLELDNDGTIIKVNDTDITSGTAITVYDETSGDKLCWVSSDGLALIVYNEEETITPVEVTLEGTKTLNGRTLAADEFSFVLKDSAGAEVETVSNAADGSFAFDALTFTEEGEYTYTVSEVNGTVSGITYDTTVYTVTITVVDNGDGTLTATPSYAVGGTGKDAIEFNSTYSATSTTATLTGTKTLTGNRTLAAGDFEFVLKDSTGAEVETVSNAAGGSFAFSALTFSAAGTYTYTVSEIKGTMGGTTWDIEYDAKIYTVTVIVIDDGAGQLAASVGYPDGGIVFTNAYVVTDAPVYAVVNGTKALTGKDLEENMFSFIVTDDDNNDAVVSTATNDEDGTIRFVLDYEETDIGTHHYTVKEVNDQRGRHSL